MTIVRPTGLRTLALLPALALAAALTGCATSAPAASGRGSGGSGRIQVVAAENFWGSLAEQIGGSHVDVHSIIDNPNADPHDYEPNAADGRAIAGAQLVVINGVGYDPWASKLVAANQTKDQQVVTVGETAGVAVDGNPHRWYSPTDVGQVIAAITSSLSKIDPALASYFASQEQHVLTTDLKQYFGLIAQIKQTYGGTPVGASESIFAPLAQALGLQLLTPARFLRAISEGDDPTAGDRATIDKQLTDRQIRVYVYNSQNATPDIRTQLSLAKAHNIPIATVTETMTPAGASFQQWQVRQLQGIKAALHAATGR